VADRAALAGLLATAGFAGVRVETFTREVRFRSVEEWVRIQFAATPLAALLAGRAPPERERLVALVAADVGERLARLVRAGGLAFPQEGHVALALVEPRGGEPPQARRHDRGPPLGPERNGLLPPAGGRGYGPGRFWHP